MLTPATILSSTAQYTLPTDYVSDQLDPAPPSITCNPAPGSPTLQTGVNGESWHTVVA
jgi:hypothetical protein